MRRSSLSTLALASFAFASLVSAPAASAADFVGDNLHVAQTLTFGQASSAVTPALDFPVLEFHADSLAGFSFATQALVGTIGINAYVGHSATGALSDGYGTITTEGKGIFHHTAYSEPTPQNPDAPRNPGGEALLVEGDARIKGALRISPSGDLSMGGFTTGPQP